jgi:geranylgeranyl diphosphate synthase type II
VDEALGRFLPGPGDDPAAPCPARLAEAMRYSVLAGGKRLRPALALMAAEASGADPAVALPAACALELVHTYSLIHDDLPAMDDDDLRRGRPSCHTAFDEATAILAGDALLTLAFEVVARHTEPAAAAAACVRALAEGAGPAGMVGGQMADLLAEGRTDGTVAALEAIHRRKTGALLRAALRLGGLSAGAPEPVLRALDAYGVGGGPGVPDRRRPARRAGRRGQAGQASRQGFRVREMDVSRFPGCGGQSPAGTAGGRGGRGGPGALG